MFDKSRVLYQDNHLIIVNKIPSEIVQGDKTGDSPLSEEIKQLIKVQENKPGNVFLGVVHRLDRPVSGVVIFAKTSKALTRLNEMLRKNEIHKKYWAIVERSPESKSGHLEDWLLKNEKQNKSYIVTENTKDAKKAELNFKLLSHGENYHLLEIELLTGRHHQIRAQLSNMGCIIKGDLKYGAKRSNPDASISLHAREISFIHPVSKQKIHLIAKVPNDKLWLYFQKEQSL